MHCPSCGHFHAGGSQGPGPATCVRCGAALAARAEPTFRPIQTFSWFWFAGMVLGSLVLALIGVQLARMLGLDDALEHLLAARRFDEQVLRSVRGPKIVYATMTLSFGSAIFLLRLALRYRRERI